MKTRPQEVCVRRLDGLGGSWQLSTQGAVHLNGPSMEGCGAPTTQGPGRDPMTRWRRCLAWLASALAVAFSCGGALAASPEEVVNQMWCPVTKTCMQWSAAPGATQYLLYRGTAGQLPALLNATTDSCT